MRNRKQQLTINDLPLTRRSGQTVVEYIILVGIVTIAIFIMGPAMKRGFQSVIKTTADQLATQENAEQSFKESEGYLVDSKTSAHSDVKKQTYEYLYTVNAVSNEVNDSTTESLTNMGLVKE